MSVSRWSELLERGLAAYNALDADAFGAVCTADVELVPLIVAVEGGDPFSGPEGIRAWFRELRETFQSIHTDAERVHDLGDAAVVDMHVRNRGLASGAEVDIRLAAALRTRSGALCWFSVHEDRDAAARTLGFPSLNMALVMHHHEAWLARDYEGAVAMMDPDIEWDTRAAFPDGELGRGIAAAGAMTRRWWEEWEEWKFEPQEYVESDAHVLVRCRFAGRGKRSGVQVEDDFFQVFAFDDVHAVRLAFFQDESQARAAAGLPPLQSE